MLSISTSVNSGMRETQLTPPLPTADHRDDRGWVERSSRGVRRPFNEASGSTLLRAKLSQSGAAQAKRATRPAGDPAAWPGNWTLNALDTRAAGFQASAAVCAVQDRSKSRGVL